jgi:hypothetical protein
MAKIPGCVAFSLPVQRGKLRKVRRFQRLFRPSPRSARAARPTEAAVSSPSGVRSQVTILFQGRFQIRRDRLSDPTGVRYAMNRQALWRQAGSSATDKAATFAAQITQTGRRLMRQTVLPTITGKITPMRSACLARRSNSARARSARRANLRFGLPLTPESGGPSRHAAAQNLRAVLRARRRQEFQNAQQDAYRCHPPGGDPGCRGPRQSRRRI